MPTTLKIISSRWDTPGGHTLAKYRESGGYEAIRKALTMTPEALTDEVKAANLLGRGGAGFPCGTKWGFLPNNVFPRYLVVNGDESEPGTFKDRLLMERDPHQLIEGMLITAHAIRAKQAFLYCRGEMALAHERLGALWAQRHRRGPGGPNGSRWRPTRSARWARPWRSGSRRSPDRAAGRQMAPT